MGLSSKPPLAGPGSKRWAYFRQKLRKVLHIGTKDERKQHRIERNALEARMRAERLDTYTRDISGEGRVAPDRRQ